MHLYKLMHKLIEIVALAQKWQVSHIRQWSSAIRIPGLLLYKSESVRWTGEQLHLTKASTHSPFS